jgi:ATP-dependent helicase HepA
VCDRTGEEGRNLQLADYAVFVDLPFDPFRIEQRCGRFDRIGQAKSVDITISTGPNDEASIPAAWAQMLNEGFRVFAEPISSLQFYSDQATSHLVDCAYNDGARGLIAAIPEVRRQLESERRRIREQDILDAAEPDNGAGETIQAIEKMEREANDLRNHTHAWIETALRFETNEHSSSHRVKYVVTRSTMVDRNRFISAGLEEYEATYDRRRQSDLPLLRVGDPFIEELAVGTRQEDCGRSFAFWRKENNWASEYGGDWTGFRIELLIERDVEPMLRAAERHCYPMNDGVLRRRIETWFPPTMRLLFLDTEMNKVDPGSSLFRVLNRQYTKPQKGGTDVRFPQGKF